MSKLCEIQIPVSINKVVLEPSHTNSFRYSYLPATMAELSTVVVIDTIWPKKPKIFTIWPFTEKVCLPNPGLNHTSLKK